MARYIDANLLECYINDTNNIEEWLVNQYNADWIMRFIETAPTADVQEVKHGKWVYHYRLKKFVCLECGYETKHKPDFNYCPNCGAKMDKE